VLTEKIRIWDDERRTSVLGDESVALWLRATNQTEFDLVQALREKGDKRVVMSLDNDFVYAVLPFFHHLYYAYLQMVRLHSSCINQAVFCPGEKSRGPSLDARGNRTIRLRRIVESAYRRDCIAAPWRRSHTCVQCVVFAFPLAEGCVINQAVS
jgi:hypothetical protein